MKLLLTILVMTLLISCVSNTPKLSLNRDYENGNQYAKDGLYKEAVRAYERALQDPAARPYVMRNLGMVLVKMKEFTKARSLLEESIRNNSNDFESHFYLAEVYRSQNQLAKAIYHYQSADKIRPNNTRNLRAISWTFYKSRFYSEAYSTAKKLYLKDKKDFQSNVILSRILIKLKKYKTAKAILKKALAHQNKGAKPFLYSVLGDVYVKTGAFDKASKAYRLALKDNPLMASALYGYGKYLAEKGDKKGAVSFWEKSIRAKPNLTEAYFSLAKAYEGINSQKSSYFYKKFRSTSALDIDYIDRFNESKDRISFLKSKNASKTKVIQSKK